MACTSGEDIDNLYIYCLNIYMVPDIGVIYLSLIAVMSFFLMWKGIKITTLPIFVLFLSLNIYLFMESINNDYEYIEILDIDRLQQYKVIDKVTGDFIIDDENYNIENLLRLPIYIILINFLSTIVYGLRHLFIERIRSYI